MDKTAAYHQRLLQMLASGEIADKKELLRRKISLCRELGMETVPPNSATLALADENTLAQVGPLRRNGRTLSGGGGGDTSMAPCPHGKCTTALAVSRTIPQSYTGKGLRRERGAYNSRSVPAGRASQLTSIGHPTDKIDLIIMGRTFIRAAEYHGSSSESHAMNDGDCGSLEDAHSR
jgi:elongator complex protein 3